VRGMPTQSVGISRALSSSFADLSRDFQRAGGRFFADPKVAAPG